MQQCTKTYRSKQDLSPTLTPPHPLLTTQLCVTSYNLHLSYVSTECSLTISLSDSPAVMYCGPWALLITCEGIIIIIMFFFQCTLKRGTASVMKRLSSCQKEVMSFYLAAVQQTLRSKVGIVRRGDMWLFFSCVQYNPRPGRANEF